MADGKSLREKFLELKIGTPEYDAAVKDFIVGSEGTREAAYSDGTGESVKKILHKGTFTINGLNGPENVNLNGVIEGGKITSFFVVVAKDANKKPILDKKGIPVQEVRKKIGWITVAQGFNMAAHGAEGAWAEAFGKDAPSFDKVKKGDQDLTPEQIVTLTDYSLRIRKEEIDRKYGHLINKLPEKEQAPIKAAIQSMYYNGPGLVSNKAFHDGLKKYAEEGDLGGLRDALVQLKFHSGNLRSRRAEEAEVMNVQGWNLDSEAELRNMVFEKPKPPETIAPPAQPTAPLAPPQSPAQPVQPAQPQASPPVAPPQPQKSPNALAEEMLTAFTNLENNKKKHPKNPSPSLVNKAAKAEEDYRRSAKDAGETQEFIDGKVENYKKQAYEISHPGKKRASADIPNTNQESHAVFATLNLDKAADTGGTAPFKPIIAGPRSV